MIAGGLRLGPELPVALALAIVGSILEVGAAVAAIGGRKVPAGALVAGLAIALGAAPILGDLALPTSGWSLADARSAIDTSGAVRLLAGVEAVGMVAVGAVLLSLVALKSTPRRWRSSMAIAGVALVSSASVLAGGVVHADAVFAGFRASADLFVGFTAAFLALAAAPDVAVAGTVSAALAFGAVEGTLRGLASILMVPQVERLEPQFRAEAIARFVAVPDRELPYQVAGLAAWTIAALALGARSRSAWTALPWLAVAWLSLYAGFPGGADLAVLAAAAPGR